MFAPSARHVHAPLILLNWGLAPGAWLCIELHPIVRVIFTLVDSVLPFLKKLAVNWHVGIFSASKTEFFVTLGALDVNRQTSLVYNSLRAAFAWTPLAFL